MENVELRRRLNGEKAGLCNLADSLFSVISAGKFFIYIMKFVIKTSTCTYCFLIIFLLIILNVFNSIK